MQLTQLLAALRVKRIVGNAELEITGFAIDSRQVRPGNIYVVLTEPELQDRTQFIGAAIEAGAVAVLLNEERTDIPAHITQVIVPETQIASAYLAARFYDHPAEELALIGITGTKGKTTTSYLVRHILEKNGVATGIIGTTGAVYGDYVEKGNTTPHAVKLQRILRQMANLGCQAVSMESILSCSSFASCRRSSVQHGGIYEHRQRSHEFPRPAWPIMSKLKPASRQSHKRRLRIERR